MYFPKIRSGSRRRRAAIQSGIDIYIGVGDLFEDFKLGFIGVEVSWRERRQGSALHPPKDPFLKGPLDSPKIFVAGV